MTVPSGDVDGRGGSGADEPATRPRGVDARLLVPALVAWTGTALGLSR